MPSVIRGGDDFDSAGFSGGGNPPGTVIYFAGNTAPPGYLKADGSLVDKTTYANLFAAIAGVFNTGSEPSTHFRLPDLRGEFIRGWADGRAVDTGRVFGSAQADDLKSHTHPLKVADGGDADPPTWSYSGLWAGATSSTGATGGAETRPRNIALLACIKF